MMLPAAFDKGMVHAHDLLEMGWVPWAASVAEAVPSVDMKLVIGKLNLDIAFAFASAAVVLFASDLAQHHALTSLANGNEIAAAAVAVCTYHFDYPLQTFDDDNALMFVVTYDSD